MTVTSSAFENNQNIPAKYTCDGENVNPPLTIADVPDTAKSLVLIVEDPDAPSKAFVHWTLYNMSPNIDFINENSKPGTAAEGLNDGREHGWYAPCPPSGSHRYFFKLYALDEKLSDMPDFTDKDMLLEAMEGHVLATAELVGLYERSAN